MPMHRWIQSAAGGTIQRLKPAVAIVRSLSRNPAPVPDMVPLIVVIEPSLQQPLLGVSAAYDPVPSLSPQAAPHIAAPHHFRDAPGIAKRIREPNPWRNGICPTHAPASVGKYHNPGD